jgi:uncharacterized protein YutE (UPF0331/DUF86 family)
MASAEKITEKLSRMDEFMDILRGTQHIPLDQFLKDKILIGSAKYYLQVSIECCLDVANRIIAARRFRAPKDYADPFKVLEENGIVTAEYGARLRQMAKFRNRLVYLYGDIDDAYVHGFISKDLQGIASFKTVVAAKCFSLAAADTQSK